MKPPGGYKKRRTGFDCRKLFGKTLLAGCGLAAELLNKQGWQSCLFRAGHCKAVKAGFLIFGCILAPLKVKLRKLVSWEKRAQAPLSNRH